MVTLLICKATNPELSPCLVRCCTLRIESIHSPSEILAIVGLCRINGGDATGKTVTWREGCGISIVQFVQFQNNWPYNWASEDRKSFRYSGPYRELTSSQASCVPPLTPFCLGTWSRNTWCAILMWPTTMENLASMSSRTALQLAYVGDGDCRRQQVIANHRNALDPHRENDLIHGAKWTRSLDLHLSAPVTSPVVTIVMTSKEEQIKSRRTKQGMASPVQLPRHMFLTRRPMHGSTTTTPRYPKALTKTAGSS